MKSLCRSIPVLILAGGRGTRLLSVVSDRPKALATIDSRPFLEIQLELLRGHGFQTFVLCVGYRADQIRATLGNGARLGIQIEYSEEGEQLLGTAGAIRLASRYVLNRALVLNGDTFLNTDYGAVIKEHQDRVDAEQISATLSLCQRPDVERFGTVILDTNQKRVRGFREKSAVRGVDQNWLNGGAYIFERPLLELIPENTPYSLEYDWLPLALRLGHKIAGHCCLEPFYDIGTPEEYRQFASLYGARRVA